MRKDIILWDWNGTMLNDVDVCVDSINQLLSSRKMHPINLKYYKEVFNFPVQHYYETLGFDFSIESFEDLSEEFISTYNSNIKNAALHPEVVDVLNHFKALNKTQIVISAMEQNMLKKMLKEYKINHFFKDIVGLSDIYASSKVELAKNYIKRKKLNVSDAVFIGDTLHDAEVAEKNGVDIILVSNGHHSLKRLSVNGNKIIDNLGALLTNNSILLN